MKKYLLIVLLLCPLVLINTTEAIAQQGIVTSVTATPIGDADASLLSGLVFDSVPGPYVAFAGATGVIGIEDYIMDLTSVPQLPPSAPTAVLRQFRFVGGVTGSIDGMGGVINIDFGGTSVDVNLTMEGDFIWTIAISSEVIPTAADLTLTIDDANPVNTGRSVVGRWFLKTEPVQLGSSPGNPFGVPADNGTPRVFAFDMIVDDVLPVEIVEFDVTVNGESALLSWSTATETNNAGFEVQRRGFAGAYETVHYVEGAGNSLELRNYSVNIADLEAGQNFFRLKQIDFDGSFEYSSEIEATVELPESFVMNPAYPNPFNPSTQVQFAVADSQPVTLEMYDVMGVKVKTLFSGTPNSDEFVSVAIDASALASGNYMLRLSGSTFAGTQMISLVK